MSLAESIQKLNQKETVLSSLEKQNNELDREVENYHSGQER